MRTPDTPLLAVPPALVQAFPPSLNGLLDLARAYATTPVLMEMARADYGEQVDEHFAALTRIRETGEVPAPIGWVPQEVLELCRWSEPDREETSEDVLREHHVRAFACAALLRAGAEPANAEAVWSHGPTLAQMTASALALGPEWIDVLGGFLTARLAQPGLADERPFFAFALLFLAVTARGGPLDGDALATAASWAIDEEAAAAAEYFFGSPPSRAPWLLRIDVSDLRDDVWRSFARRMRDEAPALPPAARDPILLLAEAMLDG
ncbi:hypothetical protein [Longimicrobium sp.]|uniref:hypothetical protein n=1 Tax=Longimicrobium sp. TaxID=2029185 RepID=UPI002E2FEF1F|nr:hypothetical protein [Longimicrobium sp.]HEX6041831.1 hypothetical protein [Longimicrobium sp.]